MNSISEQPLYEKTAAILLTLGFPAHRMGFTQLCIAIPAFARNKQQSMAKELYPYIAHTAGIIDWRAVERAMRTVIVYAWARKNPEVWAVYFPSCKHAPSNKQFIATLAEHIR